MTSTLETAIAERDALYRASNTQGLSLERACELKMQHRDAALKLLNDPVALLQYATEILGAHVPPGHKDNRVLFAVRAAISAQKEVDNA